MSDDAIDDAIAIVGLSGRFPGADSTDALWTLLDEGRCAIRRLSDDELTRAGVSATARAAPDFVPFAADLADGASFDAGLFGYTPREAELIDPQQRVFLEVAWSALESAGYDPLAVEGRIGVFGGVGGSTYLLRVVARPDVVEDVGMLQLGVGTSNDYLASRVSYKLGLRGPSLTVQTACSTSLVAVHLAVQSLLGGECDMALAGAASILMPQHAGYVYTDGGIFSPDGRVRAYDARASGIVFGNGAGVVVLRRLADARAAGDSVRAIIRGSAINNDGAQKLGYTAPSVAGQTEVIAEAWSLAGVEPRDVAFIEGHGTGTTLGDGVELRALRQLVDGSPRPIALGSLKPNVGHLNAAAGVVGLIKAVLSMERGRLPATLGYERPNPALVGSRLFVSGQAIDLAHHTAPLIAGVSSFGFGGTNAHVVVAQAPPAPVRPAARGGANLLALSARSTASLERTRGALARAVGAHLPADVAHTLAVGRHAFAQRCFAVADDAHSAASALAAATTVEARPRSSVAFVFSGQGTQVPGMGAELHRDTPPFRREVDRCLALLDAELAEGLRAMVFAPSTDARVHETRWAQPALFVFEYALAQLLIGWGIEPHAVLGHSVGEIVAAAVADALSLADALELIAVRGRAMQACPPGAMLAVALSPEAIAARRLVDVELAAVNAPELCVLAGTHAAIDALESTLTSEGAFVRRLRTSRAFHTAAMDGALPALRASAAGLTPRTPTRRLVSNVSGDWMQPEELSAPDYWTRQARQTVRFSAGVARLVASGVDTVIEVGPSDGLAKLVRAHASQRAIVEAPAAPPRRDRLLASVGRLWAHGVPVRLSALASEPGRRVPLPGYAFDRRVFDLSTPRRSAPRRAAFEDWFRLPTWRRLPGAPQQHAPRVWLFLGEVRGLGAQLVDRLRREHERVIRVSPGAAFARHGLDEFTVGVDHPDDHVRVLDALGDVHPDAIVHAWCLAPSPAFDAQGIRHAERHGFAALTAAIRAALAHQPDRPRTLTVLARAVVAAPGDDTPPAPQNALLLGPCRVAPDEHPALRSKLVDVDVDVVGDDGGALVDACLRELRADDAATVVALRGRARWALSYEVTRLTPPHGVDAARDHVLITGGLGGIGFTLAQRLASQGSTLLLTGRRPLASSPALTTRFEGIGGRAEYRAVDVTDEAAMRLAIAEAEARHGPITAVIHAAGVAGGGLIATRDARDAARVLSPKVHGLAVLDALTKGRALRWFVLCSAANTALGGAGHADYVAANAVLDAYAELRRHHRPDCRTLAIGWGTWRDVGMSVETALPPALEASRARWLATGIAPEEGVRAFERLVACDVSHALVLPEPADTPTEQVTELEVEVSERGERPAVGAHFRAPTNDLEHGVAKVFEDVLGLHGVGIDDDFIDLGGHSLLATQVAARLRERMSADTSASDVLRNPTIAKLAATLERGEPARATAIARLGASTAPLSLAQERIWFMENLVPGTPMFNEPHAMRLRGPLDVAKLERAIAAIVARHEALRTVFESRGAPVQRILGFDGLVLPLERVSDEAAARARIDQEADLAFALGRAPLFRARLFRLDAHDHVLFINAHHIVFDEWSIEVFGRELRGAYAGETLAALPIQYADYAQWQRSSAARTAGQSDLGYWTRQLDGAQPLRLPTDRPRPDRPRLAGGTVSFELPRAVTGALTELCRQHGTTPFMALFAAFTTVLSRRSAQTDISVGSPVANRDLPELEPLIGFFVNMIVLRVDLAGAPSFRALLERVRQTCLDAYAHQGLPFEQLVQALHPARGLSQHPFFSVIFDLQDTRAEVARSGPLRIDPFPFRGETPKFELVLRMRYGPSGITGTLAYMDALFDASTAQRLADDFVRVVGALLANPDRPITQPPLAETVESDAPLPLPELGIHELFAERARARPDAIAIERGGVSVSYAVLDQRARALAGAIVARGIGLESCVGICMASSVEQVLAALAVLYAGGAYLPLDPAWPAQRAALVAQDAGCALVLATSASAAEAAACGVAVLDVDTPTDAPPRQPRSAAPEQLANVIYTSGTSGRPKGVAVRHTGIVRLVLGSEQLAVGVHDRVAKVCNFAFDASTWEIWSALAGGATLVIAPEGVLGAPATLEAFLTEARITAMLAPTALFHRTAAERPAAFASLDLLVTGGEALDLRVAREVLTAGPPRRLINAYGPTESTVITTAHTVDALAHDDVDVPIGRALRHTEVLILDAGGNAVADGVVGELCIAGPALPRGYLGRPGLTARAFVPHPHRAGARIYRTGDLVRRRPDGLLAFVGRNDAQVKVRGHRVELLEIEAVLRAHPEVQEAAVGTRASSYGATVVAFVASTANAERLKSDLRTTLPDYMVPAELVVLASLPLTPNGKIDRAALAALAPRDVAAPTAPSPVGALESQIAALWCEVLGLERVGRDQNFFDVGGHSLAAADVFARLQDSGVAGLQLVDLFTHPTIAGLSAHLTNPTDHGEVDDRATELARAKERIRRIRRQS